MNTVKVNVKKQDNNIKVDDIVLTLEQAEHLRSLLEATMNDR